MNISLLKKIKSAIAILAVTILCVGPLIGSTILGDDVGVRYALADNIIDESCWSDANTRLPFALSDAAIVRYNETVILTGGVGADDRPVGAALIYTSETKIWKILAQGLNAPRFGHRMIVVGTMLYVFGGDASTAPLGAGSIEVADLTKSILFKLLNETRMPNPLSYFGLAQYTIPKTGDSFIYVFGGKYDRGNGAKGMGNTNEVHMLSTTNYTWSTRPPLPLNISSFGFTQLDSDSVIIMGGEVGDHVIYNSIELNVLTGEVSDDVVNLPYAIRDLSMCASDDGKRIFISGGEAEDNLGNRIEKVMYSWDVELNEWQWTIPIPQAVARHVCMVINDDILLIGGNGYIEEKVFGALSAIRVWNDKGGTCISWWNTSLVVLVSYVGGSIVLGAVYYIVHFFMRRSIKRKNAKRTWRSYVRS